MRYAQRPGGVVAIRIANQRQNVNRKIRFCRILCREKWGNSRRKNGACAIKAGASLCAGLSLEDSKGGRSPFGTPTLCARSSVLYLCGGDAAGVLRPCWAIHAAVSQQMAVSSLFAGSLPVHPRRRGIPFSASPFAFQWLRTMRKFVL